ncbi:MAG: acetate--CoA ligase [Actinomycetota bacterium]|nr:acetate--CoA ligase [Actinomycetota bacterium]
MSEEEQQQGGGGEDLSERTYEPPEEFAKQANCQDPEVWDKAAEDYEGFWESWAKELHWFKEWERVLDWDPPFAQWFVGGKLNASYNCLDYHIEQGRGDKTALIWVGDEPDQQQTYTYNELLTEVSKFSNILKDFGIGKGDTVSIYLPMIPELPIAMLACARIGAIHSVVFSAFQPGQLTERINDVESTVLITADQSPRGGQKTPLKENSEEALQDAPSVEHVIVVRRTGDEVPWDDERDHYWDELMQNASDECEPEEMDAEDPFYVLYSSGSTGKPKGIQHNVGGYLVQLKATTKWVLDLKDEDIFWCTADIGWVTGHSYLVYGPLVCGGTTLQFEGTPTYPENDRWWSIIEEQKVTHLYTAPTAIRAFMKAGTDPIEQHDLSSLRLLGSVGEPINPRAWVWYYENIGKERCPIVDTWWQTETGAIMIAPLPGITTLKPGSATFPFPGIFPGLWDEESEEFVEDNPASGALTINKPWPSMLRTLWQDPERYKEEYFSDVSEEIYYVEDGAKRDEEGYYTITGRIDDVLNVSGHRLSTVEIENALVGHEGVAEAAVIGIDDEDKGQAPIAFVILEAGQGDYDEEFEKELTDTVAEKAGKISRPERVYAVEDLPKTNSGKIMRRLLQNIAQGEELGDTSTLADPSIAETIQEQTQEQMS